MKRDLEKAVEFPADMQNAVNVRSRQHRLTIYLSRDDSVLDEVILDVTECKPAIKIDTTNGIATLYVKREKPRSSPIWCELFTSHQKIEEGVFGTTSTVGAAYVVRDHGKVFILTFGTGHHLLNDELIERDFGLRVTLNSVEPEKLRSLDKASYQADPLNSRTQSPKDVGIFELHVESELELIYAVTGASKIGVFGAQVTGRDALTIKRPITIDGLSEVLYEALSRYQARLPKEFEWFENVRRVKDPEELEILELLLNDNLAKGDYSTIFLGEPEIVDWEGNLGYAFDMYTRSGVHVVLALEDLVSHLGIGGGLLTVDKLKSSKVHIVNSSYQSVKFWSAYRCLYAEIRSGLKLYILRNGDWFQAAEDFVERVNKSLAQSIDLCSLPLPVYQHDREDAYNSHVAACNSNYWLMDKKNVPIGGPSDKVEFCDLIYEGKNFVHVKFYRDSGTLSHLFSQAIVGGSAFLGDVGFRERLNKHLPEEQKLMDVISQPDSRGYAIVYAIATRKELPDELPFFSKVALKHAAKTLRTLGFKVGLCAIPVDPVLLKKKFFKKMS